ncbi:hypothetical protein TrLO_g5769 [Triparma laevis f. longispina]|uniref:TNFR-Cys domain-containing protein n=1 Tax=Triparma laevis f. longispina TaxID=1714387 RepID=A0A9W7L161_9STRA|nr:hypothetical protein TrLO_g5769 [Triparma laevis f. longispina]
MPFRPPWRLGKTLSSIILAFLTLNLVLLRKSVLVDAACPTTYTYGACGDFCQARPGGEGTGYDIETYTDTCSEDYWSCWGCGRWWCLKCGWRTRSYDCAKNRHRYYCDYDAGHGTGSHLGNDLCSAGTYSPGGNTVPCSGCASGKYSGNGASSCSNCAAGNKPNGAKTGCEACPALQVAKPGAASCSSCGAGNPRQVPNSEESGCTTCGDGYYGSSSGTCEACQAGKSSKGGKDCVNCESGKYQPNAGRTTCANCGIGKYSSNSNTACTACAKGKKGRDDKTMCDDCPEGSYQDATGQTTCKSCTQGKYSTNTAAQAFSDCNDCPKGRYNGKTVGYFTNFDELADCTDCEVGKMQAAMGQNFCALCGAGRHQPDTRQETCDDCEAGKYQDEVGPNIVCKDCEVGKIQPDGGQSDCDDCVAGKYWGSATSCEDCADGKISEPGGTTIAACDFCEAGAFTTDKVNCQVCPAGKILETPGEGAIACQNCVKGKYNGDGGHVANLHLTCTPCEAGRYSDSLGSTQCATCPNGSFDSRATVGDGMETDTDCAKCSAGKYSERIVPVHECVDGKVTASTEASCRAYADLAGVGDSFTANPGGWDDGYGCRVDGKGYFEWFRGGTSADIQDLADSRNNKWVRADCPAVATECEDCAEGKYLQGNGVTLASHDSSADCSNCESGTYSGIGAAQCVICEAGKIQEGAGKPSCDNCNEGTYLEDGRGEVGREGTSASLHDNKAEDCLSCGLGKSSEEGQDSCTACPEGEFNDVEGGKCRGCERKGYTASRAVADGAKAQYDEQDDDGFIGLGCVACLCAAGQICPDDPLDPCVSCTAGKFIPEVGQKDCTPCAEGKYSGAQASVCSFCSPGEVPNSDQDGCVKCEVGKQGSVGAVACQTCAVGYVASTEGLSNCAYCGAGKMAATAAGTTSVAKTSCLLCEAGKYSVGGKDACSNCEGSELAPLAGAFSCQTCLPGEYLAGSGGDKQCVKCAVGKFSRQGDGTTCDDCPYGEYSVESGSVSCSPGPPGYRVNVETAVPAASGIVVCSAGKFSKGKTHECTDCEEGKYSEPMSSSCLSCAAGKVETRVRTLTAEGDSYESRDTVCTACPVAKREDKGSCVSCTDGYVASSQGTTTCDYCGAGKFASLTSNTCEDCPAATFSVGGSLACVPCEVGKYNANVGAPACTICPAGQVASSNQTGCEECDDGTKSTQGDLHCTTCEAGSVVNEDKSLCVVCELGKYRAVTDAACADCPVGTYAVTLGKSYCNACTAGKYADVEGLEACKICLEGKFSGPAASGCTTCPDGTRSTSGSYNCQSCPSGTYSDSTTLNLCKDCEAGKLSEEGSSSCDIDCAAGKYGTTGGATCENCDPGTYSGSGAGACSSCTSGKYASEIASTECKACGVGSVANPTKNRCDDCPNGAFADPAEEMVTCSLCGAGFINAWHQGNCTACPEGFWSKAGDSQCTKCDTSLGYTASGTASQVCDYCGSGKFVNLTHHMCQLCPPSQFSEGGQQDCSSCADGKYNDEHGQSICKICGAGSISNAAKTSCDDCHQGKISRSGDQVCVACGVGEYSSEDGANCFNCAAGKMSNEADGADECEDCVAGKYSEVGASACVACDAGRYTDNPAQGSCAYCEAGEFSNATPEGGEGKNCPSCPDGKRSNAGASECATCDAGTYKNADTNNLCLPCEAGKISSVGSAECGLLCEAGTYSTAGSDTCTNCNAGKYAITGMSSCSLCSAGKYSEEKSETCIQCDAGTFSQSGAETCVTCDTNKISDAGASVCTLCEPGRIPAEDHATCIDCLAGKYANSGDDACSSCDVGKSAAGGSANCENCEPGKAAGETGTVACTDCSAGKKNNLERTGCDDCPATEYSMVKSSTCLSCPGGSYCELGTGDPAPKCPPGTESGSGSSECDACKPGYYAPEEGSTACQACPANQAPTAGKTACTCKSGFMEDFDKDGAKVCLCGLGYTYDTKNDECAACGVGMFKNFAGNLPCLSCDRYAAKGSFSTVSPLGGADEGEDSDTAAYLAISPRNCTCEKGDFLLEELPDEGYEGFGQCVECPDGTDCDYRGVTLEDLPVAAGWWRSDTESHKVIKCFAKGACVSSDNFTALLERQSWDQEMQCAEGHYGAICNNCEKDFHMNVLGECEVCVKEVVLPIKTLITGIIFGSGVFLLGWFVLRKRKLKRLGRKGKGMTSSLFRKFRTKFKIMMTFYQVVSSYESVLHLRYPAVFENFTRMLGSIVNLDALKIMDVDCVVATNFYTKLIMVTATPVLFCMLCFSWAFFWGKIKPAKAKAAMNNAVEIFLGLSFLLFSNVSTTILETFNCDSFGDDPTLFLQQDQSVTCDNDTYKFFKMYATAMIFVFPVGITVIYSVLLIRNRKKLLDESRMEDPSLSGISFLWESYNPDCWWFEIFECIRKLCMTGLMIFVMAGSASQIVVSMLFSIASIAVFVTFKPYPCYDDDVLAICSQLSIFFTLFGGLLLRVDIADEFDENTFGMLLIFINSSSFILLILTLTPKPFKWIFRIFIQQDRHNGTLKGLRPEHDDQQLFVEYFETLALASREETGYQKIVKETATWLTWSNTTGAVMECRNSTGMGPIDEGRVTFEVLLGIEKVKEFLLNVNCDPRPAVLEHRQLGEADLQRSMGTSNRRISMVSSRRKLYTAVRFSRPMSNRDYVTEQFMVKNSRLCPGAQVIVSRSLYSEDGFLHEGISQKRGYVRARVGLMGYLLVPLEDQDEEAKFENAKAGDEVKMGRTKIIFVSQSNMESWFADVLARRVVPRGLKYTVDEIFAFASEEKKRLMDSRGKKKRKLRLKKFIKKIGKGVGSKRNLMDGGGGGSSGNLGGEADGSPPAPEVKAKNMWKGIRAGVNEGKKMNSKWNNLVDDVVEQKNGVGNKGLGGIEMKWVVKNPLSTLGGGGGGGGGLAGKFRANETTAVALKYSAQAVVLGGGDVPPPPKTRGGPRPSSIPPPMPKGGLKKGLGLGKKGGGGDPPPPVPPPGLGKKGGGGDPPPPGPPPGHNGDEKGGAKGGARGGAKPAMKKSCSFALHRSGSGAMPAELCQWGREAGPTPVPHDPLECHQRKNASGLSSGTQT